MNFDKPEAVDNYTAILPEIRTGFVDLSLWDLSDSLNVRVDAKQWSDTNARFERWNGSGFVELASLYRINVERLNGQTSDFYLNANNMNAGTVAAARLPNATTSSLGVVQLSTSTSSTSSTQAATPSAVNAVRLLLNGKANSSHTHVEGDLPNASTSAQGVVQLSTSTNSTSTSRAATPSAVNAVRQLADGKANSSHSHGASDLPSGTTSAPGMVQLNTSVSSTSTSLAATSSAVRAAYNLANSKANTSHSHVEGDLPNASTSAQGVVQLNTSTNSSSTSQASTPSALNAIRLMAEGKADVNHTHTYNDLPIGTTSVPGITRLSTSVSSTSTSRAATASAVRAAYNLADGKADSNHSHSNATQSSDGMLSSEDKVKIDSLGSRVFVQKQADTTRVLGEAFLADNALVIENLSPGYYSIELYLRSWGSGYILPGIYDINSMMRFGLRDGSNQVLPRGRLYVESNLLSQASVTLSAVNTQVLNLANSSQSDAVRTMGDAVDTPCLIRISGYFQLTSNSSVGLFWEASSSHPSIQVPVTTTLGEGSWMVVESSA